MIASYSGCPQTVRFRGGRGSLFVENSLSGQSGSRLLRLRAGINWLEERIFCVFGYHGGVLSV